MKILVVDDEEGVRRVLLRVLMRAGYEVSEAEDGKEALRACKANEFDVVITDIFMPEKEGLETIIELRTLNPDIKIIAISGGGMNGLGEHLSYAKIFGAQEILAKPIEPQDILETIERVAKAPSSAAPTIAKANRQRV